MPLSVLRRNSNKARLKGNCLIRAFMFFLISCKRQGNWEIEDLFTCTLHHRTAINCLLENISSDSSDTMLRMNKISETKYFSKLLHTFVNLQEHERYKRMKVYRTCWEFILEIVDMILLMQNLSFYF